MSDSYFLDVAREALYLVLLVSAPAVLASLAAGLITGVLQTTTSLQDHTISFVPRIVAVFGALAVAGPWIGAQVVSFSQVLYQGIPLLR